MREVRFCALSRVTVALALAALANAGAPSTACADESAERAKKLNAEAKKQFILGNFSQSATLYMKAYEAKPVPEFLHNIAQCYKRLSSREHLEKALVYFESYLSNEPDAPNSEDVEAEIVELKRRIASLRRMPAAERRRPVAPAAAVAAPSVAPPRTRFTPIYKRWWLWTVIGAVAVGGTVAAIAATAGGSSLPRFDSRTFGNK